MLYWGYGFGVWLGSGFRVFFWLEIDYREEHKEHEHVLQKTIMKRKKKKRQERHLINLFCFDVFRYKESTRKEKKMIRK